MKLKEKMKRFWTMDVHNHEGFTLVELIIVIAILAILSSVAVVGYSSYVTKANKAADETMIAEIQNALMLAYYSGEITESGYVVLSMGDAKVSSDEVSAALTAAFGSPSGLKLKHNGWKNGGAMGAYADSVGGFINNIGADTLMEDVQNCSGKLAEFLIKGMGQEFMGNNGASTLDHYLGLEGDNSIASMLQSGNYGSSDINANVLANATVFGVAATLQDEASAIRVIEAFKNAEFIGILETIPENIGNLAHQYAALEAFVGYMDCQAATAALNDFNTNGMNAGDAGTIITNLGNAWLAAYAAAEAECPNKIFAYYGLDEEGNQIEGVKSQAEMDGEAYVSIMRTVHNQQDSYVSSLNNETLFTDDQIKNTVNYYVDIANLVSGLDCYYVIAFTCGANGVTFEN